MQTFTWQTAAEENSLLWADLQGKGGQRAEATMVAAVAAGDAEGAGVEGVMSSGGLEVIPGKKT